MGSSAWAYVNDSSALVRLLAFDVPFARRSFNLTTSTLLLLNCNKPHCLTTTTFPYPSKDRPVVDFQ